MDPVLSCRGLRRSFGERVVVDDVGFRVAPGETYGLLGPNGAGKTTTISMVCGLLAPDGGEVVVAGMPMTPSALDAKAHVGLVPQELAVYPDLTATENLRFFGRLHRLADLAGRVEHVLDVVGLRDRADDRVSTYSGGMQRRLNIGIGLLHQPTLLVLDEPTVGVDPQSRDAILAAVEQLADDGLAVVYTSHYMEEVERLADRVGIMDHGRLVAEGTRRELVAMVGEKGQLTLTAAGDREGAARALDDVEGVERASATPEGLVATVDDASRRLPGVLGAVAAAGLDVTGVEVAEPDLEAVFLHLTGRALRD